MKLFRVSKKMKKKGNLGSISSTFYLHFFRQYPFAKKVIKLNVTREKLHKALSYKKRTHKMLMKSTQERER